MLFRRCRVLQTVLGPLQLDVGCRLGPPQIEQRLLALVERLTRLRQFTFTLLDQRGQSTSLSVAGLGRQADLGNLVFERQDVVLE